MVEDDVLVSVFEVVGLNFIGFCLVMVCGVGVKDEVKRMALQNDVFIIFGIDNLILLVLVCKVGNLEGLKVLVDIY